MNHKRLMNGGRRVMCRRCVFVVGSKAAKSHRRRQKEGAGGTFSDAVFIDWDRLIFSRDAQRS